MIKDLKKTTKKIHIANISFEEELASPLKAPFSWLESSPLFLHLQYLPFLYGSPEDRVIVTHAPAQTFWDTLEQVGIQPPSPHLHSQKLKILHPLEAWGMTPNIQQWAEIQGVPYEMPPWEIVQAINSKVFSFRHSPQLEGSRLLYDLDELLAWQQEQSGPKVFKTCYGVSGNGHFLLSPSSQNRLLQLPFMSFVQKEWDCGLPVIGEPWVQRILDFSTQWKIDRFGKMTYLGHTICENDTNGRYRATLVGDPEQLFGPFLNYLHEHIVIANDLLKTIAAAGFFGHVGFDAMLYQKENKILLHPIVEINARKTMGWVALEMSRRHFSNRPLRLGLVNAKTTFLPLLPTVLLDSSVRFRKQLSLTLL